MTTKNNKNDSKITKHDYILRSLYKIKHKKWELYVISRIIHLLDDLDVEFVCQQYIQRPNDMRAMADLYLPQFRMFLEIDEDHHASDEAQLNDRRRADDIINAVGLTEHRIKVHEHEKHPNCLQRVNKEIDEFIELIRSKKKASDSFMPWDPEKRFDITRYLDDGYISTKGNPVFKYQRDVLNCFGYDKGHYQRGAWTLKDGSKRCVWFPRLYETNGWENSLSPDGKIITEKRKLNDGNMSDVKYEDPWSSRLVFARYADKLGNHLYRFVGEFKRQNNVNDRYENIFELVSDCVNTIPSATDNHKTGAS